MSTQEDVFSGLKTLLENDATLKTYVKTVWDGVKNSVPNFPMIVLEPLNKSESDDVYDRQEIRLQVAVVGYIECLDVDKQIIGDTNTKGIFNFENDLIKAISADRTLGGYAIHTYLKNTKYEFVEYPIRSFSLECEILFRQGSTSRT
jgi:hypothetical protein